MQQIKELLKEQPHHNFRVSIYLNADQGKYELSGFMNEIQLEINKVPSKRQNFNGTEQQNGLYVVCPHASAATAFLNFISQKLSSTDNGASSIPDTIVPLPHTTNKNPITTEQYLETEVIYFLI
jgi:hypothetical protein